MDTIEIFCSYTLKDKKLAKGLENHLSLLERQRVKVWYDHNGLPGTEWEHERDSHLNSAHIILLLISPFFMNSPEYKREALPALERHKRGEAYVIPIILRDIDWPNAPFSDLLPLPDGSKPVASWPRKDAAFVNVVEGIHLVIEEIRNRSGDLQPSSVAVPISSSLSVGTTNQEINKALFDQFMEKHYRLALKHYKKHSDRHVKVWKRLQWTLVCLAMAVAMLVGALLFASTSDDTRLKLLLACLTFLLALTLVVVSIVLVTSYSHEKWIIYLQTVNDLEKEHEQYDYGVRLYAGSSNRERLFMERVISITERAKQVANPTRWSTMGNASHPGK